MEEAQKSRAEMILERKKQLANAIYITYPRFASLLEAIADCHLQGNRNREPECLFIQGETGTGKSTLMETYSKSYPRKITKEGTIVPILSGVVPAGATVKGVASKLLWNLGDPAHSRGSRDTMTIRLIQLIKDCRVELIFLDEMNHFIERDSEKLLKTVSDWLKELIIETKIPLVAFGLPTAELVLSPSTNPQLSRRFSHRRSLNPFGWQHDDGEEFRTLLHLIETQLPLLENSRLTEKDMALRFYYASDGTIGYVMTLIRNATKLALKQNRERLELDLLAITFEDHIKNDKPGKKFNPFLEDVCIKDLPSEDSLSEKGTASEVKITNNRIRSGGSKKPRASDVLHT